MLLFRKIDYYAQLILSSIMLLSIPFLFLYGFMVGLFIMGFWQLASAFLNTSKFLSSGLAKQICTYWRWTGLIFAFFFLCVPLSTVLNPDDVQFLAAISIAGSIPVAIYYLHIYKKLIDALDLRHELSGILKSKH